MLVNMWSKKVSKFGQKVVIFDSNFQSIGLLFIPTKMTTEEK